MTGPPTLEVPHPLYLLEAVDRGYGRGGSTVHALRGVDLVVEPGELLAVEGPSGSGKSTLLQLLGAMDTPTSGRVDFDGQQLAGASDKTLTGLRRTAIGFVFQQFNLIPTLTAAENIEIAMVRPRRERRPRARNCSRASAWPIAPTICQAGCRVASSSASPSPGRWPTTLGWFWPTNPPATSTRRRPTRSSTC